MSGLQLFELGYELSLLPIHSSECATGDSERFQLRLEGIKKLLTNLKLQKFHISFGMFERLLEGPDTPTFLREHYEQLQQTIDGLEMLILLELDNHTSQNMFKLGIGVAQIQLLVVMPEPNEDSAEIYSQTQRIISELINDNIFPEQAKAKLEQYSTVDYLLFQDEFEVLELKDIIREGLMN